MNSKITQTLIAGIGATIAMTIVIFVAPMMGMPKMNPPAMLAGVMGMPIAAGWVMHFVIGVVFASLYVFLFRPKVKIGNNFIKGAIFGIVLFVMAQVGMQVMGAMFGEIPKPEGPMALVAIGGIVGHVVFGVTTAFLGKASNN